MPPLPVPHYKCFRYLIPTSPPALANTPIPKHSVVAQHMCLCAVLPSTHSHKLTTKPPNPHYIGPSHSLPPTPSHPPTFTFTDCMNTPSDPPSILSYQTIITHGQPTPNNEHSRISLIHISEPITPQLFPKFIEFGEFKRDILYSLNVLLVWSCCGNLMSIGEEYQDYPWPRDYRVSRVTNPVHVSYNLFIWYILDESVAPRTIHPQQNDLL